MSVDLKWVVMVLCHYLLVPILAFLGFSLHCHLNHCLSHARTPLCFAANRLCTQRFCLLQSCHTPKEFIDFRMGRCQLPPPGSCHNSKSESHAHWIKSLRKVKECVTATLCPVPGHPGSDWARHGREPVSVGWWAASLAPCSAALTPTALGAAPELSDVCLLKSMTWAAFV